MDERSVFGWILAGWSLLGVAMLPLLFLYPAPYGRHSRPGWGPGVPAALGWVLMETPAPLVFGACFMGGRWPPTATAWLFLALWEAHYVHRAFVYPARLSASARRVPVAVVGTAFGFNVMNAYLNGRYLFWLSGGYPASWLADPRFVVGAVLFVAGYVINRHADSTLRNLRRGCESQYRIPYGGLFRWVSCPNYLGEIVEWIGWAIATWSLPGLSFAVWTMANLIPRAYTHHCWYRRQFPEYPGKRKALVPMVW